MPRDPSTGIYTPVVNSFSDPVLGEVIDPTDASALFADQTDALNDLPGQLVSNVRHALTADRTYYVRDDGSDSNNGLANTAGGAFLTPQKAATTIIDTLDTAGFTVTVDLTGTFTSAMQWRGPIVGGGAVTVTSTGGAAITTTSADAISASVGANITVGGSITLSTITSGACINSYAFGRIAVSGVSFGSAADGHIQAGALLFGSESHGELSGPGAIEITGNYTVSGSALYHLHVPNGTIQYKSTGVTVTVSSTPAFSAYFAGVSVGMLNANAVTYSGSATGIRYVVHRNGIILTTAGSETFFPGNAAGSVASGGVYAAFDDSVANGAIKALSVGTALVPDSPLTVSANTATTVAPAVGTNVHMVGADAASNILSMDSFGGSMFEVNRRADGTLASKSAVGAAALLKSYQFYPWDGSAYNASAAFDALTINAQTGSDHSTRFRWRLTPSGSTTQAEAMSLVNGSLSIFGSTSGSIALAVPAAAGSNTLSLPAATDTLVGKATTDELTNKTLTSSVGKGTWTASGTWTLPAFTLGGAVSGGGNTIDNAPIGSVTPSTGVFTALTANTVGTIGTAGNGYFTLGVQSSNPGTPGTNNIRLFSDATGRLSWKRDDGFVRTFASTLTADRVYTLPDAAATLLYSGGPLGSPSSAGTIPAFTLGGTIAGGGNQINNVIIGTSTPLAGAFTTLSATGALTYGGVTLTNAVTGTGKMVLDTAPTLSSLTLGTALPRASGGTANTTLAGEMASLAGGIFAAKITGVNFNSANTDNAITIPTLPTGFTRIIGFRIQISNASTSLVIATYGLYPATGAAGTALVTAPQTITVSSSTDSSANNAQSSNTIQTQSYVAASLATPNTIYFRVITAEGSAATGDVTFFYFIAP